MAVAFAIETRRMDAVGCVKGIAKRFFYSFLGRKESKELPTRKFHTAAALYAENGIATLGRRPTEKRS